MTNFYSFILIIMIFIKLSTASIISVNVNNNNRDSNINYNIKSNNIYSIYSNYEGSQGFIKLIITLNILRQN